MPRFILSLAAAIPCPLIKDDFKISGAPMAATEVVFTNSLLENDEFFFIINRINCFTELAENMV
jgi:hypothetical protein